MTCARFFLLLLTILVNSACAQQRFWSQFIESPTETNYRYVKQSMEGRCVVNAKPSSMDVTKLISLVQQKNSLAIDLAYAALSCLDGGDLEDVVRALGGLISEEPATFLLNTQKYGLNEHQFRKILTMLPLDVVDSSQARIKVLNERVVSLESMHDASVAELRARALSILDQYIETVRRGAVEGK